LILYLLVALWPALAAAQNPNQIAPSPQTAGAAASGSACIQNTDCAVWDVTQYSSITVQITGTFSGTLTFETQGATSSTWVSTSVINLADWTAGSTTTAGGQFSIANSGITGLRVRMTSYTSGTATLSATAGKSLSPSGVSHPDLSATYWIATADVRLPNAKVLGALATGLVYNTTTTGTPTTVVCGTAGTVLAGGAPPTCTATPTVTSLSAASNNAGDLGASGTAFRTGYFGTSVVSPLYTATGGTVTTSNPLISGTQTWNAGGVSFIGNSYAFTETASASSSRYFQILGGAGGATDEFYVQKGGLAVAVTLQAANIQSTSNILVGNVIVGGGAAANKTQMNLNTDGVLAVANNANSSLVKFQMTGTPTCTAANSCGTGNGTFSTGSSDTAGSVTLGTTPASGFQITFASTWAAAPACTVWMNKAGMAVGKTVLTSVTSTTAITVVTNGTAPATGDIYAYHCIGIQ